MKRIHVILGALVLLATVSACTDAEKAAINAFGTKATVECWSGATKIYSGRSTGKVSNEEHSDGYFLLDSARGKLVQVSGNCVIEHDK